MWVHNLILISSFQLFVSILIFCFVLFVWHLANKWDPREIKENHPWNIFLSQSTFLIHVLRNEITLPSFLCHKSILHWFFLFCVKEIQECHPECPSCWNNLCAQITVNWAGFVPHNGILNLQFFSQLLFSRSLLHKFTQRFCPFQQQTKIAKMGRTKYQSLHLHLSNDHCQICFLM